MCMPWPVLLRSRVSYLPFQTGPVILIAAVQNIDKQQFKHSTSLQYCHAHYQHCSRTSVHFLGKAARARAKTSSDPQLPVEEHRFHQRLPDGRVLIRCSQRHGTVLRSLVSHPPATPTYTNPDFILTSDQHSFQEVQHLSGLQASIRILPSLIVGCFVQVFTGLLVHRIPAFYLVLGALLLSSGAPLLMAVIRPAWPYWYDAFFAQLLSPLSADLLFTVGLLVVSDVFPTRTQALAGAVFNTVAQFGTGTGLTLMAVISSSATQKSGQRNKLGSEALMVGYRASFWAAFAWMVVACVIGAFGLRRMGKVGVKRD